MCSHLFPGADLPNSMALVPTTDKQGDAFTHAIEPELAGTYIPRTCHLTPRTVLVRRLIINLWLVACIVLILLGRRHYATCWQLIYHGAITQAVADKSRDTASENTVHYHFNTDLTTVTFDKMVAQDESPNPDRTEARKPIPITYLPNSPELIWEEGYQLYWLPGYCIFIWTVRILGISIAFAYFFAGKEDQWTKELHLLREGIAVTGCVRSGTVTRQAILAEYTVSYTYPVGSTMQLAQTRVTKDQYRRLTAGNPYVTVLYNVTKPSDHRMYCLINAASLGSVSR